MNSNHWNGGQLEVSMNREFERQGQMERLVCLNDLYFNIYTNLSSAESYGS
jgi:hypothetical protein